MRVSAAKPREAESGQAGPSRQPRRGEVEATGQAMTPIDEKKGPRRRTAGEFGR